MCITHAQSKYLSCILKEETVCKRAVSFLSSVKNVNIVNTFESEPEGLTPCFLYSSLTVSTS